MSNATPGKALFQLLICLIIACCSTGAFAASAGFIPASSRTDMVYDDARGVLYITNGTSVLRYKPATDSFLPPYTFAGGSLSGIDLSQDGKTLAVADRNITGIHLIDLSSYTAKPDVIFTPTYGESGTHSVAFGADGAVLVSSRFSGSGTVPLRRVDPATGAVSVIKNSIGQDAVLSASGDGTCIAYEESNISSGPVNIYDVATGTVTLTINTNWFTYEIGANRNCTQFAVPTYGGTFVYDHALNKVGTVGVYAGIQPIGVAYHPSQDVVYFAWAGTRELRAYNSTTSEELAVIDTGYLFEHTGNHSYTQGRLKISRAGTLLFATVTDGVYWVNTSPNPLANSQSLATNGAQALPVILTGSSPRGAQLSYSIVTHPAHGTLQGTPPNLSYSAAQGYSGQDSFTFKVSDAILESAPATVSITFDTEAPAVTAFTMPATSPSLTVPVTGFSATDNVDVAGYCLSQGSSPSSCAWSQTPPTSYTFDGPGLQTLYAFAKDTAGNVSDPSSAAVDIPELVPWITAFSIPPTYHYEDLGIAVTLSAREYLGANEYCISESADPAGCAWTSWPPYSYTFAAPGPHTLYAFARNGAGRVSAPATASTNVVGKVNQIPAASRIDTAYDSARGIVYITNGPSVLRYHLATQSFLTPYSFGFANLAGIDISADGNTLAVADTGMTGIHLVDLTTGTIKPDLRFTATSGESGTHSVAFGADGALLVSSRLNGSGTVPLRRVDPANGAVSIIKSGIGQNSMLSASGDRKCIAYEESNSSSGPVSIYDVASKTVTGTVETDWFTYEVGANRDCTQFAVPTYGGTFIYDGSLIKTGTLGISADTQPIGVAFNPVSDQVYFAWAGSSEVRSYDTGSYQQLASYDVGYTFHGNSNSAYDNGRLKVSRDGALFLVTVQGGVRYQRVGIDGAPVADDQGVTAYAGSPLPVNLAGSRYSQSQLSYSITTQPAHGTLQGSAPNLVYTPAEGYSGLDRFSFKMSDGTKQSNVASFAIKVRPIPTHVTIAPPTVKGSLSLSWNEPSDPDFSHIHIYRSTEAGKLGTLVADNLTGSSYTDNGLASFTTFYYTVRWADGFGIESNNTNQVSRRTMDATPPVTGATPAPGVYSAAQNITLSCNDGDGDGCAATYYCLGSGCTPTTAFQNAGILLASSSVVRFYSVDQAGNSEEVRTSSYQILPRYLTLPEEVNLGATLLYYPVSKTVTIGNSGTLPVTVNAPVSVIGPDSALFRVAPGGPAPCSSLAPTLAAGKSCSFTVTFIPDTAGEKQAFLQVASDADNVPPFTTLTGMGLPAVFLTTDMTGRGSIDDIAQSAGFRCTVASCTAPYPAGASIILKATPASGYAFSGWSGGACSGTADCGLTLTSNTRVAAMFTQLQWIRINATNASYPDFNAALQDVTNPGILKSRNVVIAGNINLSSAKTVTLLGGLADDFATRVGVTVVDGTITIRQGCLRVKDVVVR